MPEEKVHILYLGGKDPSEELYGWDEVLHIPDPFFNKGTTGVVIQDSLFLLGGEKSPWEAGWLNVKVSGRSGKSGGSPKYDGGESTPSSTPENRHVEEDVGAEVHELLLDAEWEKKMKFQLATTILATMLFLAALWQSVHADGCEESSCVAKCQQGKCETGACLGEKGSETARNEVGEPRGPGTIDATKNNPKTFLQESRREGVENRVGPEGRRWGISSLLQT
ncbi:unnamed protein product [Darwinula stevensoni]|uniref:Uncharacterized protein n=1 Tax=Darwinula stevensoni TaxID=69355 RepID=A0A7R9AE47_9CRUS|nr:unnamed protein product [Darwinula stevensoni]CAG0901552.1 unnamed protein product [Darwinula stevensoni]